MNIIILLSLLIMSLLATYLCNKYLKKFGLICLFIVSSIISFLLTFKYTTFFNINYNANSITFVTMLTALYLLLENNSKKEINKIVNLNFILTIFTCVILYILSIYTQSINDTIGINIKNVFFYNYRILIAYPISTYFSQRVLIEIYQEIKKLYDNIFISTVTTYLVIGLINAIMYILISYLNLLNVSNIIKLILSTYMMRLIITIIYSLYLTLITAKKVKK
ncbi:MAG: hypothetical protein VZS44_05235 [Bacilli bacterium]|nr:hypothetical protein [Bacilli bacterium]